MSSFHIQEVLDALLNQPHLHIEQIMQRYFSPYYRQNTNGQWDDYDGFVRHAQQLRALVAHARIEVLNELQSGLHYADRHRVHATKHDRSLVVQEVYLFAQLDAQGRLVRVHESTLMLQGSDADRDLGLVH